MANPTTRTPHPYTRTILVLAGLLSATAVCGGIYHLDNPARWFMAAPSALAFWWAATTFHRTPQATLETHLFIHVGALFPTLLGFLWLFQAIPATNPYAEPLAMIWPFAAIMLAMHLHTPYAPKSRAWARLLR